MHIILSVLGPEFGHLGSGHHEVVTLLLMCGFLGIGKDVDSEAWGT